MHVGRVERCRLGPEAGRARLHQREGRLGAFLHHVAELAGEDQLAAARHTRGLDEEDVAAHRRPRETGGHARHAGAQGGLVFELQRAEDGVEVFGADAHRRARIVGHHQRGVAHDAADLAFELPHAGFARVVGHDRAKRVILEGALRFGQAVGRALPRHEVRSGNLQFLVRRVAGKLDHLHAVAQGPAEVVDHVGRADEDDARQVERNPEVVVAEAVVLLRVQHFEEGSGRVTLDARRHLVHLVEHDHAVACAGLAQGLDDVARHGADVGAPVPADLALVVDAAERHPCEGPVDRTRDALAERGLAHPRRAGEAQERRTPQRIELLHRQVLDDASLHLVEPEMLRFQQRTCGREVDLQRRRLAPRQFRHPLEPGAQRGALAAFAGPLQAAEFLAHLRFDLLGHGGRCDGLVESFRFFATSFLAELLLDGVQLLAQQVFALAVVELLLGALADFLRQAQHLDAMRQQAQQLLQALLQAEGFQQLLLLHRFDVDQARGQFGQLQRRAGGLHRVRQLGRHARQQREHLRRALAQLHAERFRFGAGRGGLLVPLHPRREEGMARQQLDDAHALQALAQGVALPVRGLGEARHGGERAHVE